MIAAVNASVLSKHPQEPGENEPLLKINVEIIDMVIPCLFFSFST
jgi:hypothetical protein